MNKSSYILIYGDICPDNNYRQLFDGQSGSPFSPEILSDLKHAEFAVANLECPATNLHEPIEKCGPTLCAKPNDVALLRDVGFDAISLANNHILDFGEQGVRDTIVCSDSIGLKTFGAGENKSKAAQPLVVDIAGQRIGFLSFAEAEFNLATQNTPGANHFDPLCSFDDVKELKSKCSYIVVLYHGGIEYYKYPSPRLQKICRKFVASGADLVLCQHSHCIGTMENADSGVIIYGQGNSLFGYREGDSSWNEGLAVVVDLKTHELTFKLLIATPNGICYANEHDEHKRLLQFYKESQILQDENVISQKWSDFCDKHAAHYLPMLLGWGRVANKLNRLLDNRLANGLVSSNKYRIIMNLLRCESHHEVVRTILEKRIL